MHVNSDDQQMVNKGELEEIDKNFLLSYESFIAYIGQEGLKKLFSRYVLWREEGLEMFTKNLDNIINDQNSNFNHLLNLTMKLIHYFLSDKHPQIFIHTIEIFEALLNKMNFINNSNTNKICYDFNVADNIIVKLKEKLGDVNLKIRTKTIDLYYFMLKQNFCDYNNLLSELLEEEYLHVDSRKIIKTSKTIIGKLSIFDKIFEGLDEAIKEKRTDFASFPLNLILNYIAENLSHSKSEIRKLSRNILLKINDKFGFKKIEAALLKKTDEKELEKLTDKIPEIAELIKQLQINKLKMLAQSAITKKIRINSPRSHSLEKKKSSEIYNHKKLILNNKKSIRNVNRSVIEKSDDYNSVMNLQINSEKDNLSMKNKFLTDIIKKNDKDIDNIGLNSDNLNLNTLESEKTNEKIKPNKILKINKIKQLICSYCGKSDKKFENQKNLDEHLASECLLFTSCLKCKKNIEIRLLNSHLLSECTYKNEFKLCKRCKEAISISEFDKHFKENGCNPAKNRNTSSRCPLCHSDVPPLDKGLVQHFVIDGCPKHSRK